MADTPQEPANVPLVVYKLGGSLLDLPDLPALLCNLIGQRAGMAPLIVVGGGGAANLVREWDRVHHLGEERAHWLALEAMTLNEALLQTLCPELRPVRSLPQALSAAREGARLLACASCIVRWGESRGEVSLPHSWRTTSDAIAAWIARIIGAAELVLLKSAPLPESTTLADAAQAGLVDPVFPELARSLPHVSWVHARSPRPEIQPWLQFTH